MHPRKDGFAFIHGVSFIDEDEQTIGQLDISSNGKWSQQRLDNDEKIIGIYGKYKDYWITSLGFIVYKAQI